MAGESCLRLPRVAASGVSIEQGELAAYGILSSRQGEVPTPLGRTDRSHLGLEWLRPRPCRSSGCRGLTVHRVAVAGRVRRGTEPYGGALFAPLPLADRIPYGLNLLLKTDAGKPWDR